MVIKQPYFCHGLKKPNKALSPVFKTGNLSSEENDRQAANAKMFKCSQGSHPSWGDHPRGIASPHRDAALEKGLTQVPPAGDCPGTRCTPPGRAGIPSCSPGREFPAPLSYPLGTQRHQPPSEQPCPAASCCTASASSSSSSPPAPPQSSARGSAGRAHPPPPPRCPRLSPPPGRAGSRGLRCSVPGEGPRPRCRRPGAQAAALSP